MKPIKYALFILLATFSAAAHALGTITGVTITPGTTNAHVSWTAYSGAVDYDIRQVTSLSYPSSGAYSNSLVKYSGVYHNLNNFAYWLGDSPSTTIDVNGLYGVGNGTYWVIEAVNALGPAPWSNLSSVLDNMPSYSYANPPPGYPTPAAAIALAGVYGSLLPTFNSSNILNGFSSPGVISEANEGTTLDGLFSTNGQGAYTDTPVVIAQSAPFTLTANGDGAIPSGMDVLAGYVFDPFISATTFTIPKYFSSNNLTVPATGPSSDSETYQMLDSAETWNILVQLCDVLHTRTFVAMDHLMDVAFDAGEGNETNAQNNNPMHIAHGYWAIQPTQNFDQSGGKILHTTLEVDDYVENGRRNIGIFLQPTHDLLQQFDGNIPNTLNNSQSIEIDINSAAYKGEEWITVPPVPPSSTPTRNSILFLNYFKPNGVGIDNKARYDVFTAAQIKTYFASSSSLGTSTITVDDASDFAVGDKLILGVGLGSQETATILTVNTSTGVITFGTPLTQNHTSADPILNSSEGRIQIWRNGSLGADAAIPGGIPWAISSTIHAPYDTTTVNLFHIKYHSSLDWQENQEFAPFNSYYTGVFPLQFTAITQVSRTAGTPYNTEIVSVSGHSFTNADVGQYLEQPNNLSNTFQIVSAAGGNATIACYGASTINTGQPGIESQTPAPAGSANTLATTSNIGATTITVSQPPTLVTAGDSVNIDTASFAETRTVASSSTINNTITFTTALTYGHSGGVNVIDTTLGQRVPQQWKMGMPTSDERHWGNIGMEVFPTAATTWAGIGSRITQTNPIGTAPATPSAPTGVTAIAGNAQVSLAWSASTNATSYTVLRSLTSGSGYVAIASPTSTSYLDTGLTNGTTYYYVVTATNSSGTSGDSSQVSATPIAPAVTSTALFNPKMIGDGAANNFSTLGWVPGLADAQWNLLAAGTGIGLAYSGGTITISNTGLTTPYTASLPLLITSSNFSINNATTTTVGAANFPTAGALVVSSGAVSEAQPITAIGSGLSLSGGTLTSTGSGGSVTTFSAGTLSPLFTTTVTNATTTPALAFSLDSASALSWFGNGTGSSGAPTFSTSPLPASLIPFPSATSIGGVESLASTSHEWINAISTSGVPTATQPAFTDISGTATVAQGGTGQTTYTDGQLLIGDSSTNGLDKATITAGSNITVTNGHGSITIAASGGGGSLSTDYISGLLLKFNSTTIIQAGTGSAYVPSASAVVTVSSAITNTPSLAASSTYGVLLNSSGALVVTVSTSLTLTNYQGTAWEDASGNRLLGWFITDGSSHIVSFLCVGNRVIYLTNIYAASPYRVLNAGTSLTSVSVSCASVAPPTSRLITAIIFIAVSSSGSGQAFFGSSDGVTPVSSGQTFLNVADSTSVGLGGNTTSAQIDIEVNSSQAFLYENSSSSLATTVTVSGYYADR